MQLQRITKHTKPVDRVEKWHLIDADGERIGRLATKIAGILQGKNRPDYSRHQLNEDYVIVINASKIGTSGNKLTQKVYYRHSGYLGGLRTRTLEEMLNRFPERVVELSVKGMLPRNRLGRKMLRRLKVYSGNSHPHDAQLRMGTASSKKSPVAQAPAVEENQKPKSSAKASAKIEKTSTAKRTSTAANKRTVATSSRRRTAKDGDSK
ncbi:MAG: 50S ribosomal protein L13 [SAR202 cluster bacterium]|nr:50S ribosomal protein L13 [SAR202 cluster bacterium]|tara:strand:- start:17308 stop:17931 length:624 start_codon:yes stop_codon:yes gene_type:complete